MNNVLARPATRIVALVIGLVVLAAAIVVAVTRGDDEPDPGPRVEIPEDATPEERARAHLDTLPDGDHQGRLITIDETTVTFRIVQVLSGDEAVAAAREDGALLEGDSLPGDVYVRDLAETRTMPKASDAAIHIQQCANGCQEVPATWEAIVNAEAAPHGGNDAVFVFTMSGGAVVSLNEMVP